MTSFMYEQLTIVSMFVGIATGIAMLSINCCKKRSKYAIVVDAKPIANVVDAKPIANVVDAKPIANVVDAKPIANVVDAKPACEKPIKTFKYVIEDKLKLDKDFWTDIPPVILRSRFVNYPFYHDDDKNFPELFPSDPYVRSEQIYNEYFEMIPYPGDGLETVEISGVIRTSFEDIHKMFGPNTKTVRFNTDMKNIHLAMEFIKFCPNLETLHIENCKYLKDSYYHVRLCPKVKNISFINCELLQLSFFALSQCSNLESLTIRDCPVNIEFIEYKFPSLKYFSTNGCKKYTQYHTDSVPNLTHLDLSGSKDVTRLEIILGNQQFAVVHLNVCGCKSLNRLSFYNFFMLETVTYDDDTPLEFFRDACIKSRNIAIIYMSKMDNVIYKRSAVLYPWDKGTFNFMEDVTYDASTGVITKKNKSA